MSSNSVEHKIESEVFRRLLDHLRSNNNVQNIDLMNLAGFCRNCLSKWYVEAAKNNDKKLTYDEARNVVYDMPYEEWKAKYQK
jgi:uncharacterized protein